MGVLFRDMKYEIRRMNHPMEPHPIDFVPEPYVINQDPTYIFTSTAHPGTAAWQRVYAGAVIRPLAVCVLPVMIAGLVAVLQGYPALAYLTIGFPAALSTAVAWTFFRMHATVAEVHVRPGEAAVRTVWECLHARPLRWLPIYELRAGESILTLALGDSTYELDRKAWPEANTLLDALKTARSIGSPRSW